MLRTANIDLSSTVAGYVQDEGGHRYHPYMVGAAHTLIQGVEGVADPIEAVTLSAGGAVIAHVRAPGIVPIGVRRLSYVGDSPSEHAEYVLSMGNGVLVEVLPASGEAPDPCLAGVWVGEGWIVVWARDEGGPAKLSVVDGSDGDDGLVLLVGYSPGWRGIRDGAPLI